MLLSKEILVSVNVFKWPLWEDVLFRFCLEYDLCHSNFVCDARSHVIFLLLSETGVLFVNDVHHNIQFACTLQNV